MRVGLVLIGVLLCANARVSADDWSLPNISKQVLRLDVSKADGARATCSAVIVADGYALSAAHCVTGSDVEVTLAGRYATVHRSSRLLDLAVVKFAPRASDMIVPLGKEPDRGRDVAVVGFAFGKRDPTATFGRVAVPEDEEGYLVLNADAIFGMSGCPVLDRQGALVGILSAIQSSGPAHLALAIRVEVVREFVADLLPQPKVPKAKP